MLLPSHRGGGAWIDDAWSYRGLRTVLLGNDHLTVIVVPDKGADIVSVVHRPSDTELLWRSPNGLRDSARTVVATGDPEQAWLDLYEGGWQTVVPNGGAPSRLGGADLGVHGEANLLPWDAAVVEDGPDRAVLRCRVDLPRTPLRVRKTVTVTRDEDVVRVDETVENTSDEPLPLVYGHHLVFGPPFLAAGCRVQLPPCTLRSHPEPYAPHQRLAVGATGAWPDLPTVAGGTADLSVVPGPDARTADLAYATGYDEGRYELRNPLRGIRVEVTFPPEVFAAVWMWQMYGGGSGYPWWGRTYNLGLEPFTAWPNLGLEDAVRRGTAPVLAGGSTLQGWIALRVIDERTSP